MRGARRVCLAAILLTGVLLAALYAEGNQAQQNDTGLDESELARIEAAIKEAFPTLASWQLRDGGLQWTPTSDLAVQVDVVASDSGGRMDQHPSFRCLRAADSQKWTCGSGWTMRWEIRRQGVGITQCGPKLTSVTLEGVPDRQWTLDVVDFFGDTPAAAEAVAAIPGCGRRPPEAFCRLQGIRVPGRADPDGSQSDLMATFEIGAGSSLTVQANRDCTAPGPCLIQPTRCSVATANE